MIRTLLTLLALVPAFATAETLIIDYPNSDPAVRRVETGTVVNFHDDTSGGITLQSDAEGHFEPLDVAGRGSFDDKRWTVIVKPPAGGSWTIVSRYCALEEIPDGLKLTCQ